jgi:hypothetical protein
MHVNHRSGIAPERIAGDVDPDAVPVGPAVLMQADLHDLAVIEVVGHEGHGDSRSGAALPARLAREYLNVP